MGRCLIRHEVNIILPKRFSAAVDTVVANLPF
jgi:hypothetical protein